MKQTFNSWTGTQNIFSFLFLRFNGHLFSLWSSHRGQMLPFILFFSFWDKWIRSFLSFVRNNIIFYRPGRSGFWCRSRWSRLAWWFVRRSKTFNSIFPISINFTNGSFQVRNSKKIFFILERLEFVSVFDERSCLAGNLTKQ